MGNKHFFISIILATLIHGVLLFAYFNEEEVQKEGTIDKGKDGLIVGVGITGSFTENTKEDSNNQETVEKQQSQPQPKSEPKPEPKQTPKPKPEPKTKVEPKPQSKVEPAKEVVNSSESTQEVQNDSQSTQNSQAQSDNNQASKNAQTARTATGTGKVQESGGNPGAKLDYLSIVKTRISNAKEYPSSARKEGVIGTATVSFLLRIDGKAKEIQLVQSSGDERLDEEAMKMIKKASPFPAIPEDVSTEPMLLTLPIEFTLKTIKNKFY